MEAFGPYADVDDDERGGDCCVRETFATEMEVGVGEEDDAAVLG